MKRNYHYILSATPANLDIDIRNYVGYFQTLRENYNNHIVSFNPKEIDSISLSKTKDNTIIFNF